MSDAPRPWEITEHGDVFASLYDAEGSPILGTWQGEPGGDIPVMRRIVTAVNQHGTLVAFVRRFWAIRTAAIRGESPPETLDDLARTARELLRADDSVVRQQG